MSLPLILACLWAVAATITAFLPLRRQMAPGLILLVAAPVLMVWIGLVHGWLWVLPVVLAFASMMRNPLIYLWKRSRGITPELPPELRG